jgi:hypothetical protein
VKIEAIQRLQVLGETMAILARLATRLDAATEPYERGQAQREAMLSLRQICAEDEALWLVRWTTEKHFACRTCTSRNVQPASRIDQGVCLECARQISARAEAVCE